VLARGVAANAWPAEDAVRRAGEITGALVSLGSVDSKTEKTETRRAPNAAVWSAHMSVCARAGRAREALDALALMRECGVALDAYTLASALTACRGQPRERRGDWRGDEDDAEASEEVFSGESDAEDGHERGGEPSGASFAAASPEALEALEAFETAPASVSGTVAVRNAAIALYAAAGRADRAFALYESMRASPRGAGDAEPGRRASRGDGGDGDDDENRSGARARALPEDAASSPDTITYNTLISACASSDAPARAEELHRDMVAAGVPRSGRTYVGLMTAAARAADPGEGAAAAARVFALAEADETTEPANAFTYTALIDAQVKGRDPDAAFATFERMKSAGVAPTVVTFGCLLNACRAEFMNTPRASRREALGEDLPALPSMKNASSSESHAASDAEKETRIFDANSARSHIAVSRAYDLLSQMSRFGVCPNDRCQNALVRVVSEAGRVDDALDEVKKIARGGGRFERATLEGVVLALCREGYAERALRIVGWMDVRGYAPGPAAYRALVRACSIEGSVTTAWRVHSDGRAKISYRPDRAAASALILALSRAALAVDPSDARVMTRRAMGVFDDATREGIAREWGEDDNVPELSPNAADAESSVGGVARGDAPAGQFCPVRLLDASPRAFLFAGDAVMSSPDAILTPAAARALVAAAARCGELRFAMSLFRSEGGQSALRLRVSSEEDDRRAALEALIETCCHEGDADGALEVFDVVKSFDIPVGKVTLAFLENFCRRSRVPEWRVFDVCAQMRAQSEKKKQQSLRYSIGATAKKKSHHVFGSVSSELRDFGLGVGRGDDA
jgi:pentatricopeptide repeat protein